MLWWREQHYAAPHVVDHRYDHGDRDVERERHEFVDEYWLGGHLDVAHVELHVHCHVEFGCHIDFNSYVEQPRNIEHRPKLFEFEQLEQCDISGNHFLVGSRIQRGIAIQLRIRVIR